MNKTINDFIKVSIELGKELAIKDNLTEKEEKFLEVLATILKNI